jgi:hypothetical protein
MMAEEVKFEFQTYTYVKYFHLARSKFMIVAKFDI